MRKPVTFIFMQDLLDMPTLPQLVKDLQEHLAQERIKRQEFYEWVDEDSKVEFINGEIIMHSPATNEHSDTVGWVTRAAGFFVDFQDIGKVKSEKAMVSLTRNDYEPDVAFWKKEKSDKFTEGQTHFPAPDLVVEVLSKSTASRDKTIKFQDYAAHGVEEYWIVDPKKKLVEQYILPSEDSTVYALWRKLTIDDDIESIVLKGFKIPVKAIFDAQANIDALKNLMIK